MSTTPKTHVEELAEQAAAGERVAEFLRDPAVGVVLRKYEDTAIESLLAATSDEDRRSNQARVIVVRGFTAELHRLASDAGARRQEIDRIQGRPKPGASGPRK